MTINLNNVQMIGGKLQAVAALNLLKSKMLHANKY